MHWRDLRNRVEYVLFRCVVCVVDAMSPRAAARAATLFAWSVHYLLPRKLTRYDVAEENLQRVCRGKLTAAEVDRLVFRMWVHLFRMVTEIVQSPRKLHIHSYRDAIQFSGHEATVEAICSGRPVLFLGGHFGNWEVGISIFGLWGFPMGVIARELDNPYLHDWFKQYRESTGHRLLLKSGDYDDMLTLMQQGGSAGFLCDQDAGSRGLFVDFFGTPASTFKSLALLSLEFNTLLIVGYSVRREDNWLLPWGVQYEMGCPLVLDPATITASDPVKEITQRFTTALEHAIRQAPEQYFWVHRRWKSEPRQRKKKDLLPVPEQRRAG